MRLLLTAIMTLGVLTTAHGQQVTEYKGLCEASAGAFIDDKHFVVASDETNILQIYQRGVAAPIRAIDMMKFTNFDKSDLEAAAKIGDRIYWLSSHSFNSRGEDKAKRKIFFATRISQVDGKPTLTEVGKPFKALRDPLVKALGVKPTELNIEALAATPEGGLLIGLRAPLRLEGGKKKSIMILLKNPAAVVDVGSAPQFGEPLSLDLENRGLRSMDLIGVNPTRYVIVAGPVEDARDFAIYRWAGPGTKAELSGSKTDLSALTPEAAMAVPGEDLVQLLSDDGEVNGVTCDDENGDIATRKFRSVDVKP